MGRHKTYDRDDLIGKATELFRDHGFGGTSTQMLVEGLGLNRDSVYAEFGNKQALRSGLRIPRRPWGCTARPEYHLFVLRGGPIELT